MAAIHASGGPSSISSATSRGQAEHGRELRVNATLYALERNCPWERWVTATCSFVCDCGEEESVEKALFLPHTPSLSFSGARLLKRRRAQLKGIAHEAVAGSAELRVGKDAARRSSAPAKVSAS